MLERPSMHALAVFLAVIQHETMTAAAEAEGISQPAISVQIKGLEGFFGTPLMERSGRRVRPTAAGLLVADFSRKILATTDEMCRAVADLEGLQTGQLTLGASSTVGEQLLPAVFGRFHRLYEGVRLVLSIGNTGEIIDAVLNRTYDLGIVGREPDHPELWTRPVFDDHLDIFAAHDSPWTRRTNLQLADLANETFILRETGSATRDLALQCLATHDVVPRDTIELGSNEAVKRAVADGLGIGVLSTHTVSIDQQAGAIAILSCDNWHCRRQFHLIYRRDRTLTRAEQAFIALL